jgi:alcohol dehydrogenase class IV
MPTSPENLAMFESDWPGTGWNRGKSSGLPGPRRDGDLDTLAPGRLAKFHAPEIVFGPGALAELGHCTARTGARRPFLVTDPGLTEAGWVDEAVAYLRQSELRPSLWHGVTPNPHIVPRLARMTIKDACLATNPRAAVPDIEALFRAAL